MRRMPNANTQPESPDEIKITRSQVLRLLQQVHPDKVNEIIPEHKDDTATCSQLLYDVMHRIKSAEGHPVTWSPDIREQFPVGTEITLVGVRGDELIPPVTVPLRRPDVFVRMYESFLKTGGVPQELIDDDAEPEYISEEDADEAFFGGDIDEEMQEHLDDTARATTIEQVYGIKISSKGDSHMALLESGVLHALDEKAQKILVDEITDGSNEKLQLALTHLQKYGPEFTDPTIADDLQALLDSRIAAVDPETTVYASPTNSTRWEREAAEIKSIDELASFAVSVRTDRTMTNEDDRRRSRRSIDTMAKNLFIEETRKLDSVEGCKDLYGKAQEFPFAENEYGEDVKFIVETNVKNYMLGKIEEAGKAGSIDELNALEQAVNEFPYPVRETVIEKGGVGEEKGGVTNKTLLLNEITVQREKIRGNDVTYQTARPDEEKSRTDMRRPNPSGFLRRILRSGGAENDGQ